MVISVYIATSLDGYIARSDGSLDWLPGAENENSSESHYEDYGFYEFLDSVDALLLGRKTWDTIAAFPDAPWPYGSKPVYICSKNLQPNDLPQFVQSPVSIIHGTAQQIADRLKAKGVKHLYIDGGKIIDQFIQANLIDFITITQVPVLIGSGIPLFPTLTYDINLKLLDSKSFRSGFVQSKYLIE